jgi:heterotetrameric sarcosine oxidase gamma subunit
MHELSSLQAAHALGPAVRRGAFGASRSGQSDAFLRLRTVTGCHVAQAHALRGRSEAFAREMAVRFPLALPGANRCATSPGITLIGAGPGRWLMLTAQRLGEDELGESAILFDLSGSRVLFSIEGPKAAAVLAKGTSIDLDESRFGAGSAALTRIGHFSAVLWRPGNEPRFCALIARSFAESFWEWLVLAGEEFGGIAGEEEPFQ